MGGSHRGQPGLLCWGLCLVLSPGQLGLLAAGGTVFPLDLKICKRHLNATLRTSLRQRAACTALADPICSHYPSQQNSPGETALPCHPLPTLEASRASSRTANPCHTPNTQASHPHQPLLAIPLSTHITAQPHAPADKEHTELTGKALVPVKSRAKHFPL